MSAFRQGRMAVRSSEEELTYLESSGSGKRLGVGVDVGRRAVGSYGKMSPFSSPRSVVASGGGTGRFFCEPRFEEDERPYFLDACALCKKSLGGNGDIFMYRGDTPFCSEECRQEQIDMDEAKDKNWNKLAVKASSRKEPKPNTADQSIHVRATGAIVAG